MDKLSKIAEHLGLPADKVTNKILSNNVKELGGDGKGNKAKLTDDLFDLLGWFDDSEAEIPKEVVEDKKKSIREVIEMNAEEVITDAENIIEKLKDAESFCKANNRPFKHYYIFQCQITQFIRVFKKMQR